MAFVQGVSVHLKTSVNFSQALSLLSALVLMQDTAVQNIVKNSVSFHL
jgi:hypothetical protein